MNEVIEAECEEVFVNERIEDVENLDVHHRSGTGLLTSTATHTGVSLESKMC